MARRDRKLELALGRVIREFRGDAGLSQERLAHAADLSANYVSELERGLKAPSLSSVAAIARALNKRPYELVRAAEDLGSPAAQPPRRRRRRD